MTEKLPDADQEAMVARWVMEYLVSLHEKHPHVAVAVADAFLECTAPEWPELAPFLGTAQSEADWWADCATGQQVTAMLTACLKRMVLGQMVLALNARKRAMVAIWNSLPSQDRAAFLEFIDRNSGVTA
jgi:hypothetical protein